MLGAHRSINMPAGCDKMDVMTNLRSICWIWPETRQVGAYTKQRTLQLPGMKRQKSSARICFTAPIRARLSKLAVDGAAARRECEQQYLDSPRHKEPFPSLWNRHVEQHSPQNFVF